MKTTDCVLVHTLWQGTGDVHAARCRLRVTDPKPIYFYQQHGYTKVSREALHRVEFWCNEGRLTGVASRRGLIAAGYDVAAMEQDVSRSDAQGRHTRALKNARNTITGGCSEGPVERSQEFGGGPHVRI